MDRDYVILAAVWIVTVGLLVLFVPRDKIRQAWVAFLFKQMMTWSLGLTVVQLRMIEYPVRCFPYANRSSFTFEFFVYPAVCAIFNVRFPYGHSLLRRSLYYISFCTAITVVEVIIETYTDLVHYVTWDWYWTWGSLFVTFYFSRLYYQWFFRKYGN